MQMSSRCNRLSQQQQCLRFLLMGKRVNVMHSRKKNPSKSSTLGKTSTQTYRFLGKCIIACLLRPVWGMTHLITGVFLPPAQQNSVCILCTTSPAKSQPPCSPDLMFHSARFLTHSSSSWFKCRLTPAVSWIWAAYIPVFFNLTSPIKGHFSFCIVLV